MRVSPSIMPVTRHATGSPFASGLVIVPGNSLTSVMYLDRIMEGQSINDMLEWQCRARIAWSRLGEEHRGILQSICRSDRWQVTTWMSCIFDSPTRPVWSDFFKDGGFGTGLSPTWLEWQFSLNMKFMLPKFDSRLLNSSSSLVTRTVLFERSWKRLGWPVILGSTLTPVDCGRQFLHRGELSHNQYQPMIASTPSVSFSLVF